MSSELTAEFESLVNAIKEAVKLLPEKNADILVTGATLSLKVTLTQSAEGKYVIKPVTINGKYEKTDIQEIEMQLERLDSRTLGTKKSLEDVVLSGFMAIMFAAREAAKGDTAFRLKKGQIKLQFGVKMEGGIQFFFSGKAIEDRTHSVTLTIEPKK